MQYCYGFDNISEKFWWKSFSNATNMDLDMIINKVNASLIIGILDLVYRIFWSKQMYIILLYDIN